MRVTLAIIIFLTTYDVSSAENTKYMGAISCASSACHGNPSPLKGASVFRNEFTIWSRHDSHSRAFKILSGEDAKKIAINLGLKNPEKEPQCLTCHSTYIKDPNQISENFRIEDGVSCETCHGASEKYLKTHTRPGTLHKKNIELGMLDMSDSNIRAEICLSCHQSDKAGSANHKLLGAGHPRLSFELETFSITQPGHFKIDDDYIKRKGPYSAAKNWLTGQILQAIKVAQNLQQPQATTELSNFYCQSCHHPLEQKQFRTHDYQSKPGELRLNAAAIQMVETALKVLNPKLAREFIAASDMKTKESILMKAQNYILNLTLSENNKIALLEAVLAMGSQKSPSHFYEVAEQIAMAASNLISEFPTKTNLYKTGLEKLYKTLENPSRFEPNAFSDACLALLKQ